MYRRIVLVDQEETKNYASLFGREALEWKLKYIEAFNAM